jgi:hypothetical protein
MTRILRTMLVAGLLLALAVPAFAATLNGVTPLTPKSGATVKKGSPPTFKAKVKGEGSVFLHICKSKKKDADGLICNKVTIAEMKKKAGVFRHTPKDYDFPGYWLVTPGTYYWQAHRIQCDVGDDDCHKEGPVVKFRVR